MDRDELAAHVDELARGGDFVEAVQRFAAGLSEEERELLGAVLLDRAGHFERAAHERLYVKGWFRRQFDRLDEGRLRSR